jgi:hypothetical protein
MTIYETQQAYTGVHLNLSLGLMLETETKESKEQFGRNKRVKKWSKI